jgi:hypothetical protein
VHAIACDKYLIICFPQTPCEGLHPQNEAHRYSQAPLDHRDDQGKLRIKQNVKHACHSKAT